MNRQQYIEILRNRKKRRGGAVFVLVAMALLWAFFIIGSLFVWKRVNPEELKLVEISVDASKIYMFRMLFAIATIAAIFKLMSVIKRTNLTDVVAELLDKVDSLEKKIEELEAGGDGTR